MKNILLLIDEDAGQEARLQAALDVTRAMEGHLTCLDVRVLQPVPGVAFAGDMSFILENETERDTANRALLQQRLSLEDVSWDWIDKAGFMAPCVEDAAALADLIVVDRGLERLAMPDMKSVTAELILGIGRPLLAVPEHVGGIDIGGRVLVAWDGTSPAIAALKAAVPLLQLASGVTLLQIDDGSVTIPAEEAAVYLSRHGVHCDVARRAGDAGETLFDECISGVFAYLVMGGFSRNRFVEALLGGVTRKMLRQSPISLFLAH
jgi:nucleotide-binding universal stress UspA family protein